MDNHSNTTPQRGVVLCDAAIAAIGVVEPASLRPAVSSVLAVTRSYCSVAGQGVGNNVPGRLWGLPVNDGLSLAQAVLDAAGVSA